MGALCLVRIAPLLEVIRSPLRSAVGGVIDAGRTRTPVSDEVVIHLDDFLQSVEGPSDTHSAMYYQLNTAYLALLAGGALGPGKLPLDELIANGAENIWRGIDECRAVVRNVIAPDSLSDFTERETAWQELDRQIIGTAASDPEALPRHFERVERAADSHRTTLKAIAKALHWPVMQGGELPADAGSAWRQQTPGAVLRREQGAPAKPWYVRITAFESAEDEPFETLIQADEAGHEVRKVTHYLDGRAEWAAADSRSGRTMLSAELVPSLSTLMLRDDIYAEEVTQSFFVKNWDEARDGTYRLVG